MDLNHIEIILVEDSASDALLTKFAFEKHGLGESIIHLTNGEQALEFFFKGKNFNGKVFSNDKTKIILLDIHMPKVDGVEVLAKLKGSPVTRSIPVIILTSSDHDPVIQKCKSLGSADYILKPVTMEGFLKVVNDLTGYWTNEPKDKETKND
jgi:two-component system response regulator